MNIIERIKGLFNKSKKLPEGTETYEYSDNKKYNFHQSLKISEIPQASIQLEDAIQNWVQRYLNLKETQKNGAEYSALVNIKQEKSKNYTNNQEKIEKIRKKVNDNRTSNIVVSDNQSADGKGYINLFTINRMSNKKDAKKMQRLYINCEQKNIPNILKELMDRTDSSEDFHMKFWNGENDRDEKIVVYVNDDIEKERMLAKFEDIQQKKPKLFENAKKFDFLEHRLGVIGTAEEPTNNFFRHLDASVTHQDEVSYNLVLSRILKESFENTLWNISIGTNVNKDVYYYMYKNMPEYTKKIDKLMVANVLALSRANGITINTNHHQNLNSLQKGNDDYTK